MRMAINTERQFDELRKTADQEWVKSSLSGRRGWFVEDITAFYAIPTALGTEWDGRAIQSMRSEER